MISEALQCLGVSPGARSAVPCLLKDSCCAPALGRGVELELLHAGVRSTEGADAPKRRDAGRTADAGRRV